MTFKILLTKNYYVVEYSESSFYVISLDTKNIFSVMFLHYIKSLNDT